MMMPLWEMQTDRTAAQSDCMDPTRMGEETCLPGELVSAFHSRKWGPGGVELFAGAPASEVRRRVGRLSLLETRALSL